MDGVMDSFVPLRCVQITVGWHGPDLHRGWDDMMWNGAGGLFMIVWLIFGLLLLVALVVGIVWLVRQIPSDNRTRQSGSGPASGPDSARADLDRRYARGEISRDEYLTIRDDLEE